MYKSNADLQKEYGISRSTVDRVFRMARRIYPASVISYGGRSRIEADIFHEVFTHKDRYERGIIYEHKAAGTHQTAGRQPR